MNKLWALDGLNCAGVNREQMKKTLEGGVRAMNLTSVSPFFGLADTLIALEETREKIRAMDDVAVVVKTVSEIEAAAKSNRVGIILGTQHSLMVEDDLRLLASFKELGLRILQPTYNSPCKLGYGAPQTGDADKGITAAGREWLEEMHRLNLVVDLSHCGHNTATGFIEASKGRPLVISHANSYEICPSPRNKTDAHIRGVAETGGLTGAVMWSPAVRHDKRPTMDDYLNHLEHLIKVGGIEHAAFSSDVVESPRPTAEAWDKSYGPNGTNPNITGVLGDWYVFETRLNEHYASLTDTPGIWDGLRSRGHGEDAVEKVMRGNWLRVLKDVWGG